MANLRKNIARKRQLEKRNRIIRRNAGEATEVLVKKNYTVRAGKKTKVGLMETIEKVKAVRKDNNIPATNPSFVFHRYGKNSVRKFKVA